MLSLLSLILVGFFLGMRHATDPDHVIAVTTIVTRRKSVRHAALIGVLWGLGHTITIFLVGMAIILFSVVIPVRVGLTMELSVGLMLILLGALNLTGVMRWISERFTAPADTPSLGAKEIRASASSARHVRSANSPRLARSRASRCRHFSDGAAALRRDRSRARRFGGSGPAGADDDSEPMVGASLPARLRLRNRRGNDGDHFGDRHAHRLFWPALCRFRQYARDSFGCTQRWIRLLSRVPDRLRQRFADSPPALDSAMTLWSTRGE